MAFLGGKVDTHRDHDIRRALAPLASLAERTGAAVVVVRHLNKGTGTQAMYRGGGSIGIAGAARSVLLVAPDPTDATRRVLATVKSNLAECAPSLAFTLTTTGDIASVNWIGQTDQSADALLSRETSGDQHSAVGEAAEFLRAALADRPRSAAEVLAEARTAGIARRTLDRARRALGVVPHREGFQDGRWVWSLPKDASLSEGCQPQEDGALQDRWHSSGNDRPGGGAD